MYASDIRMPITGDCDTILVAIELSQRTWLVTVKCPGKGRFSHYKLPGGDHAGLLALIAKVRARVERALGSAPAVVSCYEAGYDGFWLHHLLTAAGIRNLVFDPASIAVEQRGRRAKTDRIDGEALLRTLGSYLRGDPRVVRVVRVPSREQEDARRASRERKRLVEEQTSHTNRIKALLRLYGLAAGNPRRKDWPAQLAGLRDWQGQPVPPHVRAELEREHARLMQIREHLEALAEPCATADRTAAEVEMSKRKDLLQRLKGVGPVFAGTLASEVFYKDFANRRQVAAYCGLDPSPWRSGTMEKEQGISKAGNPRARTQTLELTWLWLQNQPNSALTQWFLKRTANASGRMRRVAIVALARKLVVALWRYVTTGLVPDRAVLKAGA
jgi:transposase